jgi:hypothetical protein
LKSTADTAVNLNLDDCVARARPALAHRLAQPSICMSSLRSRTRLIRASAAARRGEVEITDDQEIQGQIEELVAKEHELLKAAERQDGLDASQHEQLQAVKVELDRYWDLLRQRRAHEEFGLDPDNTSVRDAKTVEGYKG